MLRHDEVLRRQIRVVATTDAAPIPPLVAAPNCPDEVVARLQSALEKIGDAVECESLRDRLGLRGFTKVDIRDYEVSLQWDAEARLAGYPEPG
jgi:ABC-type phosphate/phosphonate transport system substrate-binding protein